MSTPFFLILDKGTDDDNLLTRYSVGEYKSRKFIWTTKLVQLVTINPIERSYRNTGTKNALAREYRRLKNITEKHLWHNSFGLKSYLKPGHTRSLSMNVAFTVSMRIWKIQQQKVLMPDTTSVQWIIAVVTVSRCKVKW